MLLPYHLAEHILCNLLGLVAVHHDFLDDDPALLFNFGRRKFRVQIHIGQHISHWPHILRPDAGVITSGLLLGERVQISAAALNRLRNSARAAFFSALEKQMLQEMAHALQGRVFITAAGPHPNSHRDAGRMRHLTGNNAQAVVELRFLSVKSHDISAPFPEARSSSSSVTVLS